jgi:hypothetical protein
MWEGFCNDIHKKWITFLRSFSVILMNSWYIGMNRSTKKSYFRANLSQNRFSFFVLSVSIMKEQWNVVKRFRAVP